MASSGKAPAVGKLGLKRFYERTQSIEPFYTGGPLALSRSGAIVACGCGGQVKIVDVTTGAVLQDIEADGEQVTAIALSPNEQELVTSGRDFLVKTWDVSSGTKSRMWKSGQGTSYVQRLCYDETGTLVAGGCSDFVVRVWDAGRGFATHNLKGHGAIVTSVCFGATPRTDPNKLLLFSGADDGEVRVWALATKTCKAVLKGHDSAVTAMVIDVPTKSLLTAGRDRVVGVWDLKAMKIAHSIPIFDTIEGIALVAPLAEEPVGKKGKGAAAVEPKEATARDLEFVTAGEKGALKRWKVGTGKCLVTEDAKHGCAYEQLLATHGSTTLLGVTIDQSLLFQDPATLKTKKQMVGHNDEVIDCAFASAETIAVCTNSDHLRIFELESRACRLLHGHTNIILAVDCNAVAGLIATSSKDQLVRVWHLASGRCVGLGEGHVDAVGAVAVAPRNSLMCASGSADRTIKLWDLSAAKKRAASEEEDTGGEVPKLKLMRSWAGHEKDINSIAISPNDGMVASGSQDRSVKLWDAASGDLKQTCKGHKRGVWCVKFSPVDKVVASASADATVKLWSISDGACLKSFQGHEGSVLKVAFVCAGMQLLSSGSDGLVKLWTIKTYDCVDTFDHHTDKVWALAVAPGDDTLVVTGGADGVINVWDDKTLEQDDKSRQEREDKLLLEQDLMNALRAKDFRKAAILAFELHQPFRLLQVVQEIMALNELEMLDDIVVAMKPEQLVICLGYIRDWNTTARNSHQAQVMLLSILRVFPMETLVKCKGIREVADAMIPYTERHFQRLEDALQRTYALDFTLHAMNKVLGGDDGFEDEGQTLGWSIDTKGKHRRGEDALEEAAAPAPRPDDEADGESDDGDDEDEEGGAAGWGSWGGAAGDAADDGEDEDEEEDQEEEVEEAASRPARAEKTPQGKKNAREPAATTGKRKSKGAGGEEAGGDGETGGGGAVVKKRKSLPGTERAAPTTPARKRLDVDDAPPSGVKSGKKSRPGAGEETPGKGARSPVATRSVKTPGKSGGSSVKKSKTRE